MAIASTSDTTPILLDAFLCPLQQALPFVSRDQVASLGFSRIGSTEDSDDFALLINARPAAVTADGAANDDDLLPGAEHVVLPTFDAGKFLAHVSMRKVHISVQHFARNQQAFAALIVPDDAHLLVQFALFGDLQLLQLLLLQCVRIVQQKPLDLVPASIANSSHVIFHARRDLKNACVQVADALRDAGVLGNNLGEVPEHCFCCDRIAFAGSGNDADHDLALAEPVVVFAEWGVLVAPYIHQRVRCRNDQTSLLVSHETGPNTHDLARLAIP
mmetsp:Transcript_12685/g.36904  ORF Transcript_12685/g.36904 Transcript_12685/m.36904 type:complete len:273 (+) Transcript_12685:223-1041(+)